MRITMDMLDGSPVPRRGDLIQSNGGNRRERTWMVLAVHVLKPTKELPRCRIWAERWWELEPELRVKLWTSAERAGGQRVINFKRYAVTKPKSFEDYLRR